MSTWYVFVLAVIIVLGGLSWLIRRLVTTPELPCDLDWVDKFSINRYRPMQRLLSEADSDFLLQECGYDKRVMRAVLAQRRRLFRVYLRNLNRDFGRLHYAARLLLLDSPVDRPELAQQLVQMRVAFFWAVLGVHYRLVLHAAGIGNVDVRGLLNAVEGLRVHCDVLVPMRAAV
jgi:hypothetical protein